MFLAAPLGIRESVCPAAGTEGNFSSSEVASDDATTLDFANGLYARKMYGAAIMEYRKFIRDDSDSPEVASAKFRFADSHYFLKDYEQAIGYFRMFVEEYPADSRVSIALFRAGTARYYLGQIPQAIRTFGRVAEDAEDPNLRSGALYYLAKCYETRNQSEKVEQVLSKVVREYPQTEYASYAGAMIGDHFLKEKNYEEAVKGYQMAVGPNSPPEIAGNALLKIAEIYFDRKDYSSARGYYQKILESLTLAGSGVPLPSVEMTRALKDKALLGLFYCDYNLQDLVSAKSMLETYKTLVEQSATKPEVLYLLASLLFEKKDYELSLKLLDDAMSTALPDKDGAMTEKILFKKARVLSQKGGVDEALAVLEKLIDRPAKDQDRAYFEKGEILREAGRDSEALKAYEATFAQFGKLPYGSKSLFQEALLYLKLNDAKTAKERFLLFIEKYFGNPDTARAELEILQIDLDAKNFEEVVRRAQDFIKLRKDSGLSDIAQYKMGVALMGLGRFEEAGEVFKTIIAMTPPSKLYPESLYAAGASFESRRRIREALPFYEKLLKEFPDHALSLELATRQGYLYIAVEDFEKASAFYQNVLFNHPEIQIETDGVFWLVRYLLDEGDYETLQRVLEVFPSRFPGQDLSHEVNFFRGEASIGLKDYAKAVEFYSRAVAAKTDGAFAPYAYLGIGLCQVSMGDDTAAEKNFIQCLKYDHEPKVTIRARFETANLKLRQKKIQSAATEFMRVAILYDDSRYVPLALYKAGECFRNLQKIEESDKAFLELKTRYPQNEWTKKAESVMNAEASLAQSAALGKSGGH